MLTARDIVYLSGPMTGHPGLNRDEFYRAAEAIEERYGCNVINPANLEFLMGEGRKYEHLMEVDLALVRTSTALVSMPEPIRFSTGALRERAQARECGIKILQLEEVLPSWGA
ncbi:MAG: DUF4406 domain-containing protein [Victivallaceae bacterium]